jgi:anthranilate phosphoribosyltransferase
MDEISPSGCTSVWEVQHGTARRWELNPASYGLECTGLEGLAGGEPQENAELIEQLFDGRGNPAIRCAALLNAAAALYVSGNGWAFEEAVERSRTALDSGGAARVLGRLRAAAPAVST